MATLLVSLLKVFTFLKLVLQTRRVTSHLADFSFSSKTLIAELLQQGYWYMYHKIGKAFTY